MFVNIVRARPKYTLRGPIKIHLYPSGLRPDRRGGGSPYISFAFVVLLSVLFTSVFSTLPADSTPNLLNKQGEMPAFLLLDVLLILVCFCTLPAHATQNYPKTHGGMPAIFC